MKMRRLLLLCGEASTPQSVHLKRRKRAEVHEKSFFYESLKLAIPHF